LGENCGHRAAGRFAVFPPRVSVKGILGNPRAGIMQRVAHLFNEKESAIIDGTAKVTDSSSNPRAIRRRVVLT
jgi:hypothetical protein